MAFLFTPTNLSSHPAGARISYKKLIDDDHRDLSGLTDVEKVSFELATWTFKFHNGYDNRIRQSKPTVDKCGCLAAQAAGVSSAMLLDWLVRKSWKDVGEVITDREFEPTAAFNNGEDGRDAWSSVFAADVDPVGSAQGDGTHGILGEIVAQFQFRKSRKRVSRVQMASA
jgi:hypothetical protein